MKTAANICDGQHWNPALWRETPAPKRVRGWRATHCTKCGKFLGYRQPDANTNKEAAHAARVAEYVK